MSNDVPSDEGTENDDSVESQSDFQINPSLADALRDFAEISTGQDFSKSTPQPNVEPHSDQNDVTEREDGAELILGKDAEGRFQYTIIKEIARGGMGTVYLARDEKLGRDLAVKVMHAFYTSNPDAINRFIKESQISSQLQHPNITPVFEMGHLNGRPFLAMRLVRGKTLRALLDERKHPDDDHQKWLDVFEKICEAMAYAHSQNVIHRDLKPSNIMVGAFGEVQVMDWGLAKKLQDSESSKGSADSVDIKDKSHSEPNPEGKKPSNGYPLSPDVFTVDGELLGTFKYMAPEQARGDVHLIDKRTDVFLMGATLCDLVTGAPPFSGEQRTEEVRKAQLNDAVRRIESSKIHADLKEIATSCLNYRPESRPKDAGVVSQLLTKHRKAVEQELRQAERRQARLKVAIPASIIGAAFLIAFFLGWLRYVRIQDAQVARLGGILQDVGKLLLDSEQDAGKTGETSYEKAQVLIDEATRQSQDIRSKDLELRLKSLVERKTRVERFRKLVNALQTIRIEAADYENATLTNQRYFDEFKEFGIDIDNADPKQTGQELAEYPARGEIAGGLFDWARKRLQIDGLDASAARRLIEIANSTDQDELRTRIRNSLGKDGEHDLKFLVEMANDVNIADKQSAETLIMLSQRLIFAKKWETSRELLLRSWRKHPNDFWTNFDLGSESFNLPKNDPVRLEERVRFLTAAVALRPTSARLHMNLGMVQSLHKRDADAIHSFEDSVRLDPSNAKAHYNLGDLYRNEGRLVDSVNALNNAITIRPDYFQAYASLGMTLEQKQDIEGAFAAFKQSLEINPDYAEGHFRLGNLLTAQNRSDEAIEEFVKTIVIDTNHAGACLNLGVELHKKSRNEEALAAADKAIRIQPSLAAAHNNRGNVLRDLKRDVEAIGSFQEAVRLDQNYAEPNFSLGLLCFRRREFDSAITYLNRSIELNPKLWMAHSCLGETYEQQGKIKMAIDEYRIAKDLQPEGSPMIPQFQKVIDELEKANQKSPNQ